MWAVIWTPRGPAALAAMATASSLALIKHGRVCIAADSVQANACALIVRCRDGLATSSIG